MALQTTTSERSGTFSALRLYDFRLFFIGQFISITGTWMQTIAQGYLVYQLTKSEAWLGLIACASGLAVILLAPLSGVIVDRLPRRRVLYATQTVQMMLAFILFALNITNTVQVWHIVVLAFLLGLTNALDFPARQTFLLEIVGSDYLKSSIALNSIVNNVTRIIGPAIAGVLLISIGTAWCFFLNGISYIAVLVSLWLMHVNYPIKPKQGKSNALADLKDGLVFSRNNEQIAVLLILAFVISFWVVPLVQMLPSFASSVLHSPEEGYATLSVAQGLGAVIGGLTISMISARFGYWRVLRFYATVIGVLMLIFAIQTHLTLASLALSAMWFFVITAYVCINTLLQSIVPNEFRGRVLALYTLSFTGVSPFGALILGFIANHFGTPLGIALYAVLTFVIVSYVLSRFKQK